MSINHTSRIKHLNCVKMNLFSGKICLFKNSQQSFVLLKAIANEKLNGVDTLSHTKNSLDMSNVTGQYYQMGIGKKDILFKNSDKKMRKFRKINKKKNVI